MKKKETGLKCFLVGLFIFLGKRKLQQFCNAGHLAFADSGATFVTNVAGTKRIMKYRTIQIWLSRGWHHVLCSVSLLVFSAISTYSSAKTAIRFANDTVSVDLRPVAGDTIRGIVKDDRGPMMMVNVTERSSDGRMVAYGITDADGKFSFCLVDPRDRLQIACVGYDTIDIPISERFFDIKLNLQLDLAIVAEKITESTAYGPIPLKTTRPRLVLNGKNITRGNSAWKGIDLHAEKYTNKEISRLFGIKAKKIKTVSVTRATIGHNGVIEVTTVDFKP